MWKCINDYSILLEENLVENAPDKCRLVISNIKIFKNYYNDNNNIRNFSEHSTLKFTLILRELEYNKN